MGLALLLVGTAQAATFVVDTTVDAVDATPGNGTCATGAGSCSLRAAVQEANALAGADRIELPAGTFVLSLIGAGEDAAATGDLDVAQELEVVGHSRDATVVDGFAADRLFHVVANVALKLQRLTLRRGEAFATGGGALRHLGPAALTVEDVACVESFGGGAGCILMDAGDLTIRNSAFSNVGATGGGGAIFQTGTGTLSVADSTFNHTATSGQGGAIFLQAASAIIERTQFTDTFANSGGAGAFVVSSGITLNDCTTDSTSAMGPGGAFSIAAVGTAPVGITNLTARDTSASGPGGVAYLQVANGTISIDGATVENASAGGPGGAFYVAAGGTGAVTLSGLTVSDSQCTGPGGALFAAIGGDLSLTAANLRDNTALPGPGGALYVSATNITLNQSLVTGNIATGAPGGAMYFSASTLASITESEIGNNIGNNSVGGGGFLTGGEVRIDRSAVVENVITGPASLGGGLYASAGAFTLSNTTVSGNAAGFRGGGLFTGGPSTLTNVTFADNDAADRGGALEASAAATVTNTVFAAGDFGANCAGTPVVSAGNNLDSGGSCALAGPADQSNTDPQLGPLAAINGLRAHQPAPGSPLVDRGANASCPPTDQTGVLRPTDGDGDGTATCDIGAIEFLDNCPGDPAKTSPGICGCGVADTDANGNGVADCLLNGDLKAQIARGRVLVGQLDGSTDPAQTPIRTELTTLADGWISYVQTHDAALVKTAPKPKLIKLARRARAKARAAAKKRGAKVTKAKTAATKALDAFDGLLAP